MNVSEKKFAVGAALLGLLTVGAAMPASAAPVAALSLPTITWPWEQSVAVESIELGDYAATMTVGETQTLAPTVLPDNANPKTVTYESSNESVATVSNRGLVTAVSSGSVQIAATAGDVTVYYSITVQTDPSTWVSEMDITLSANKILVGDTASVSIQVLPSNASNTDQLTLTSSNTNVATVNSFGKVTGIAPGTATITATCGSVTVSAKIAVVSSASESTTTEAITLNTNYVVLKPGGTATLTAKVTPSSASQKLTYKSNDSSVAAVSSAGVITATGTGATSVIVSNGTASALVTVIVNRTATAPTDENGGTTNPDGTETTTDAVAQAIEGAAGDEVLLMQSDVPMLSAAALDALRTSGKTLVLEADTYTLRISGASVSNTNNILDTALNFTAAEHGVEFTLNGGENLPGDVEITLTGEETAYKRLYLYNEATEKWQYLNTYSDGVIDADTAGRYLLTNDTLNTIEVNWYFLAAAGVIVLAIAVAYIVFKKRYWFW